VLDPLQVGVIEEREGVGDDPCRLVDLLGGGGRVFVDEHAPQFAQTLLSRGHLAIRQEIVHGLDSRTFPAVRQTPPTLRLRLQLRPATSAIDQYPSPREHVGHERRRPFGVDKPHRPHVTAGARRQTLRQIGHTPVGEETPWYGR
jgi:hypothetical protein